MSKLERIRKNEGTFPGIFACCADLRHFDFHKGIFWQKSRLSFSLSEVRGFLFFWGGWIIRLRDSDGGFFGEIYFRSNREGSTNRSPL